MNKYKAGPWLVLFAALLWAVDAPFRKYLTESLSSGTIVLMEHILIGILVLPLFYLGFRQLKDFTWKEWGAAGYIAVAGSVLATVFFTESFRFVNPSVAILLQKIQPLIAILLAWALLREKLTRDFWLWALIGVLGAYLVSFPEIRIAGLGFAGGAKGIVFALLAAFFWGSATVAGRFLSEKRDFKMITSLRFLIALLALFVWQIWNGNLVELTSASGEDWGFVFIIAVLAGFFSLLIYYKGLKTTKASIATIAELAFPFSAVIINWIFLGAALDLMQIVGGLILLLAITKLTLVNQEDLAERKGKLV